MKPSFRRPITTCGGREGGREGGRKGGRERERKGERECNREGMSKDVHVLAV